MLQGKREVSAEHHIYQWNPQIACRTMEETAFILYRSKMVSLNDVGTFIWERFKQACGVSEVVSTVVDEFETSHEQAQQDVNEFVMELISHDLLIEAAVDEAV